MHIYCVSILYVYGSDWDGHVHKTFAHPFSSLLCNACSSYLSNSKSNRIFKLESYFQMSDRKTGRVGKEAVSEVVPGGPQTGSGRPRTRGKGQPPPEKDGDQRYETGDKGNALAAMDDALQHIKEMADQMATAPEVKALLSLMESLLGQIHQVAATQALVTAVGPTSAPAAELLDTRRCYRCSELGHFANRCLIGFKLTQTVNRFGRLETLGVIMWVNPRIRVAEVEAIIAESSTQIIRVEPEIKTIISVQGVRQSMIRWAIGAPIVRYAILTRITGLIPALEGIVLHRKNLKRERMLWLGVDPSGPLVDVHISLPSSSVHIPPPVLSDCTDHTFAPVINISRVTGGFVPHPTVR